MLSNAYFVGPVPLGTLSCLNQILLNKKYLTIDMMYLYYHTRGEKYTVLYSIEILVISDYVDVFYPGGEGGGHCHSSAK